MNEILESLALAEQLRLRFDEHFLPKCLEYLLSNVPVENVRDPRALLSVKFVRFLQIIDKIHFTNDFIALCFIELSRLLDELLVQVDARQKAIVCQFAFAQFQVDLYNISQLLVCGVNDLLAQALFFYLVAYGCG